MTDRYHRQQRVPQFGSASQQRLSDAKVLIVGVGGLGSPVSTQLAGAGIGQLTLVDHDVVSLVICIDKVYSPNTTLAKQKFLRRNNASVR